MCLFEWCMPFLPYEGGDNATDSNSALTCSPPDWFCLSPSPHYHQLFQQGPELTWYDRHFKLNWVQITLWMTITSTVHCLQGQSSAASVIMTGFAFVKNSLIRKNNQPVFKGPKRSLLKISFSNLWNCSGLRPETRGISTLLTPSTAILWGPTLPADVILSSCLEWKRLPIH